jgi:hypothetical protein
LLYNILVYHSSAPEDPCLLGWHYVLGWVAPKNSDNQHKDRHDITEDLNPQNTYCCIIVWGLINLVKLLYRWQHVWMQIANTCTKATVFMPFLSCCRCTHQHELVVCMYWCTGSFYV